MEKYLARNGVRRIEAIVLSHFHDDHTSAVADLIDRFEVGAVYFPDVRAEQRGEIERAAERNGTELVPLTGDTVITPFQNLTVELLCGQIDFTDTDDENEHSMVALADFKGSTLLVTGDVTDTGERALVRAGTELDCDVLKVAHHGSRYSTTAAFLREATPLVALVSVGSNSFGHPTDETLERLADYTQFIFRTDELGTVELYTEGGSEFMRLKG